jgi:hypothetical protein
MRRSVLRIIWMSKKINWYKFIESLLYINARQAIKFHWHAMSALLMLNNNFVTNIYNYLRKNIMKHIKKFTYSAVEYIWFVCYLLFNYRKGCEACRRSMLDIKYMLQVSVQLLFENMFHSNKYLVSYAQRACRHACRS